MNALVAFAAVGTLSAVATPLFAALARRVGLVVEPRADRWHGRRTPLLGGAGIALAALVGMAAGLPATTEAGVLLLCAAAAFGLGLLDDFRSLAPATKLVGQVLIASALAFGGVRVEVIEFTPLAYVVSVVWIVAIMNAVNLMDNMDGLAAGVTAIAAAVLAVTSNAGSPIATLMATITAAAAVGFLVHNFPPAKVFMGDAGSQLLGFLLAATALIHTSAGTANVGLAVLAPLAALALPIFDTALVTFARRLRGVPIGRGGRDHTSHLLASLGLSDRAVVLVLYGVAAVFGLVGVGAELVSGLAFPLFVLGVIGLVLFGAFLIDTAGPRAAHPATPLGTAFATYGRFGAEVALDVALLTTVYYLANVIRFEGQPESAWADLFVRSIPVVVGVQLASLVVFGVYRTLWRYMNIGDAAVIVRALTVGSAGAVVLLVLLMRFEGYSRAVFVLDWLLACGAVVGVRAFLLWLIHELSFRPRSDARRVLVVGANESGMFALRLLGRASEVPYHVVGFLDDDPGKRYRRVGGVRVVGTTAEVASAIDRLGADLVVVAGSGEGADVRERIHAACDAAGIEYRDLLVTV